MALKGMRTENADGTRSAIRGRKPDAEKEISGGWYAALQLESFFSQPRSKDDMGSLGIAQKKAERSSLPPDKKKLVEVYIALSKEESGGRFSVVQAEAAVNDYSSGSATEENFAFEMRLMEAWCGGKLQDFIRKESASIIGKGFPERDMLVRMAELAEEAAPGRPVLAAVAASALRVYYPPVDEKERVLKLAQAIHLLESVLVV